MSTRSYQVAVVAMEDGARATHHGYIQLAGEVADISGYSTDLTAIDEAVQKTFPGAVEYLPMRIPNRQYRRFQREQDKAAFGEWAYQAFGALATLKALED